jgi:beta-lactam-binding protein with PASTA domain
MSMHHTLAVQSLMVDGEFVDEGPPPPVVTPPPRQRKPRTARSRRRRRATVILVILLLLGAAAGYSSWWYASGRYGKVPSLVSLQKADALAAIKHAGYKLVDGGEQYQFSDTVPKDEVISSDPSGGARVPHSHRIMLVISKGKDLVTIPTVIVGSSEADARALLGTVQITVDPVTISKTSDTVAAGKVLGTDPKGAISVKRDGRVTLIISSGPPILTVPDETGQLEAAATKDLAAHGFKVKSVSDYSPIIDKGKVISQTPVGQAQLTKFKTVTITVSNGPAPVVLPAIMNGTPYPDAVATLQALGLSVEKKTEFGGSLNLVVGMDPKSGTTVPYGSTVTLTVV